MYKLCPLDTLTSHAENFANKALEVINGQGPEDSKLTYVAQNFGVALERDMPLSWEKFGGQTIALSLEDDELKVYVN